MSAILFERVGPLCTVQDEGRPGLLRHGVSASGPMDRGAFRRAGGAGRAGIEFTTAGLAFTVEGAVGLAGAGGDFRVTVNGQGRAWPLSLALEDGDRVEITPGTHGNYGYLCFDRPFRLAPIMGSLATNLVVGLGGLEGRALRAGDRLAFGERLVPVAPDAAAPQALPEDTPIHVVWGLHADLFPAAVRERFVASAFRVSSRLDRMGARLIDEASVFGDSLSLSLVSDAIVAGDIQILGDGTPIVLLRDHQPTGGYPRIATVISADLDRFVQLRPGAPLRFRPVTLARAHAILGAK